jgi:hypothetical protein
MNHDMVFLVTCHSSIQKGDQTNQLNPFIPMLFMGEQFFWFIPNNNPFLIEIVHIPINLTMFHPIKGC